MEDLPKQQNQEMKKLGIGRETVLSLARRSRTIVNRLADRVSVGIEPASGGVNIPTMGHIERLTLEKHHGRDWDQEFIPEPNRPTNSSVESAIPGDVTHGNEMSIQEILKTTTAIERRLQRSPQEISGANQRRLNSCPPQRKPPDPESIIWSWSKNNSNARALVKTSETSSKPLFHLELPTFRNYLQRARRRLFNTSSNESKDTQDEPNTENISATSSPLHKSCGSLDLSDSSTSSESSRADFDTSLEFARDLNFLSKCGNMMSSPDKGSLNVSPTKPKCRPNRELCDEQSSSQSSRSGRDMFDISLPPPDSITKALYSSLGHGLAGIRQRSSFALSPLAVSKHRQGVEIKDRVTRIGQQYRSSGTTDDSLNDKSPENNSDEDDTQRNTKFSPSKEWRLSLGSVFSTPVRRCLTSQPFSPPLLSTAAAIETRDQLGGGKDSPSTGKTTWKRFRNEDEEAVYFLITKYLEKEDYEETKEGVWP